MERNIVTTDRAGIVPATPLLRSPRWAATIQTWMTNSGCVVRELAPDYSVAGFSYRLPATIPDAVRADLPQQIARHRAAMTPATVREIRNVLGQLSIHYPDSRSTKEWQLLARDYIMALNPFPADIVAEAARQHLTASEEAVRLYPRESDYASRMAAVQAAGFFPRLAVLIALAETMRNARRDQLHFLEKASNLPTPDELAAREAEEARKIEAAHWAERRAEIAARPWLMIYYAWAGMIARHRLPISRWWHWLEQRYEGDELLLDAAHAAFESEMEDAPILDGNLGFERLRQLAQRPRRRGDIDTDDEAKH